MAGSNGRCLRCWRVDPASSEVVAEIPVGKTPGDVAVGEGAVWVVNQDSKTISRIEPETRAVETFAVAATPLRVAAGERALWIGVGAEGTFGQVLRLDPVTLLPRASIDLPVNGDGRVHNAATGYAADQLTVALGSVLAVTPGAGLARIDPASNRADPIRLPVRVFGVASDGRAVWALGYGGDLVRVNPRPGEVSARVVVPSSTLVSIAVGGGFVWAGDAAGLVWRIESPRRAGAEPRFRTIEVESGLPSLAFGEGGLWVADAERGAVSRIGPGPGVVEATFELGNPSSALATGEGAVWAAVVGAPPEGGEAEAIGTARSDGTRASVSRELFATSIEDGLLGSLRFDQYGDPVRAPIAILVADEAATGAPGPLDGARIDRVVEVPPELLR